MTAIAAGATHCQTQVQAPAPTRALETFLRYQQAACVAGTGILVAAFLVFTHNPLLLVEAAVVGAAGLVLRWARRPLRRDDYAGVVTVIAVVSWLAFIGPVALTPFVEPIILLAALLPVVVAIPHVSARRLFVFVGCAIVTTALTLFITRTQDLMDIGDEVPRWFTDTVVLLFAPFLTGLIGLISRQNHASLQQALTEAHDGNRRLAAARRTLVVQAAELQASRARLAAAIDRERRRIERDLHDGAQQRLLGLTLNLGAARALVDRDPGAARELLGELEEDAARAVAELRDLAHGVYPAVLTDHGLAAALSSVAAAAPSRCRVDADGLDRLTPDLESTVYFCCVEALHNATKHAGPDASIVVRLRVGATVVFEVVDDGSGFEPGDTAGNGLANLADRVGAAGGTLEIRSAPGRGTTIRGEIPQPDPQPAGSRSGSIQNQTVVWPMTNRSRAS